jgi:hypothetical protein
MLFNVKIVSPEDFRAHVTEVKAEAAT